jgi:hypothetical protein
MSDDQGNAAGAEVPEDHPRLWLAEGVIALEALADAQRLLVRRLPGLSPEMGRLAYLEHKRLCRMTFELIAMAHPED